MIINLAKENERWKIILIIFEAWSSNSKNEKYSLENCLSENSWIELKECLAASMRADGSKDKKALMDIVKEMIS